MRCTYRKMEHIHNFLWDQLTLELSSILLIRIELQFFVMKMVILSNESQQDTFLIQ